MAGAPVRVLSWDGQPDVLLRVDDYWLTLADADSGAVLLTGEMVEEGLNYTQSPHDGLFDESEFPPALDGDAHVACVCVRDAAGLRTLSLELLEPGADAARALVDWIDRT